MIGGTWLISGGTGAFGQAFTRYLLDHEEPASVRIFSRGEAKQAEMKAAFHDERLRFLVGDVRNSERLLDACRGVDTVIAAAALKRVETCEEDPIEAVRTNVWGTWNTARACIERGVKQAVLLSTDKAAAPATLYGSTKMVAERLWLRANIYSAGMATRFACTRYGNVLGSTGSVVPVWQQQAASGTITVTDARSTRFWMPMEQAVGLVLTALAHMQGGETFLPKMLAAPILRLADAVAPGATRRAVGLRHGEKLHETLVTPDEVRRTWDCGAYLVITPDHVTWRPYPIVPDGVPVPANFTYSSDTARQLTVEELTAMVNA